MCVCECHSEWLNKTGLVRACWWGRDRVLHPTDVSVHGIVSPPARSQRTHPSHLPDLLFKGQAALQKYRQRRGIIDGCKPHLAGQSGQQWACLSPTQPCLHRSPVLSSLQHNPIKKRTVDFGGGWPLPAQSTTLTHVGKRVPFMNERLK